MFEKITGSSNFFFYRQEVYGPGKPVLIGTWRISQVETHRHGPTGHQQYHWTIMEVISKDGCQHQCLVAAGLPAGKGQWMFVLSFCIIACPILSSQALLMEWPVASMTSLGFPNSQQMLIFGVWEWEAKSPKLKVILTVPLKLSILSRNFYKYLNHCRINTNIVH